MTPLDFRNTNTLWCSVLVETLARCGVRQVVISPGSRSAPLTFAFARHDGIEAIPVLDERSAGFFALGLAKRKLRPVALVCTSGTAAANFLPAVVEAHESGVPLLVFTADRPPELRDCHSGQTIDQQKLYGAYAGFAHEMAVPRATLPMLRYVRQTIVHAVTRSLIPAGPVHLNCPFRDPLPPVPEKQPAAVAPAEFEGFFDQVEEVTASVAVGVVERRDLQRLRQTGTKGLIVVGPQEMADHDAFAAAVGRLSAALGWPVLADALAPLRTRAKRAGNLVAHYDAILRDERRASALRPEQVICLGGWPTSKALRGWLQQADPRVMMVSERPVNRDALHLRTRFVAQSPSAWATGFSGRRAMTEFGRAWLAEDRRVGRALAKGVRAAGGLVEPQWPAVLATALPVGTPCFLASSMPVRDAEYFWPAGNRRQEIHFSRGANGIDGTLSTALGLAHGNEQPAVLVTGDLALLHDTNGFLSVAKLRGSLTIVLINNAGGGIFEHLPVAQFNPPFEEFFATPQQVDFARLAAAYDVAHVRVRDARHLAQLCAKLPPRGVRVLELRTDRKRDAVLRRELFARG